MPQYLVTSKIVNNPFYGDIRATTVTLCNADGRQLEIGKVFKTHKASNHGYPARDETEQLFSYLVGKEIFRAN